MGVSSSRTGALLGALVSIRRHEKSQADRALMAATQLGAPEPLRDIALLYAMSDPNPDGAQFVTILTKQQPDAPLSRFARGTSYLEDSDWPAARAQFTPLMSAPHSVFGDVSGGLVALTLYAQDRRDDVIKLLSQRKTSSAGWLEHLLLMRLLAADNPRDPDLRAMFRQTAHQIDNAPTLIQIWFLQFEASWLTANEQNQSAAAMLARLRQDPQTRFMAARGVSDGFPLKPSTQYLAAELMTLYVSALSHATALAEAGSGGQHVDPDTLQLAKRYQEAILYRALYLAPHLSLARLELARMQVAGHHFDEARQTLSAIGDQDASAIAATSLRLDIALREEDMNAALPLLKSLNRAFPNDVDMLLMQASVEMALNRYAAALKHCDQASHRLSPSDRRLGDVYYCRGSAYDRLGHAEAAEEDFARALSLNPDQPELLNNVGYRGILRGDAPKTSMKLLQRAHRLAPGSVEANDSYGWGLLIVRGDVKAALPLLTKAIENRPDDPEIGYHLGVAYWYEGMKMEARTEWNRALANKPQADLHTALMAALDGRPPALGHSQGTTAAQHHQATRQQALREEGPASR